METQQPAPHEVLDRVITSFGLPKAEIARQLGVRPQAVTNWTSPGPGGRATKPSLDNIRKMEELFGTGGELLRAYGYEVAGTPAQTTEAAIRSDPRLSDEDKDLLLRLVSNFARRGGKSG